MSPLAVVLRIAAIIFIAEALVMFGLWLAPTVSDAALEALIDATALTLLSAPPVYFWVIRPYILARDKAEKSLSDRESHLRTVMENVTEGIITIDEAGIITSANHYTERLFGYPTDELIGQPVHMLMTGKDKDKHDGYVQSYVQTGKGKIINVGAREVTGRHKDGREIHIDLNVSDVDLDGKRMFIGILHNLTQRKSMEIRLRHGQKIEALGKLTGGITHEFNNLLMVIQGSLERLGENSNQTDKTSQRFLTMALEGVQRGKGLTGKLLAYSRDQTLRPVALDPRLTLPQMGHVMQQVLGETFDFDTIIADDVWDIYVDSNELEAAILNLSVNARDVMPAGGNITLRATNIHVAETYSKTHPGLKQGDYVQIALTDTGRGMSPEVIERAFDPFFTTKDTGKGTGLGLSMIYGFAKQSGGYVAIDSELGTGTTITIYLPKSKLAAEPPKPERPVTVTTALLGKGETILVVEDDPVVRMITVTMLESMNFNVQEAESGLAALEILDQNRNIRLMLTDIVMPGELSGIDLAAMVALGYPDIKIIYAPGYSPESMDVDTAGEISFPLLKKPYKKQDLAQALSQALSDPRGDVRPA